LPKGYSEDVPPELREPVPYNRQTVDARNPIARFAHRRRLQVAVREAAQLIPATGTLLDFGCGPGIFLRDLGAARRDVELIGYDPYAKQTFHGMRLVSDPNEIVDGRIDMLTALETCEHLTDSELSELIRIARRLLQPSGALLISVPIIGGPGLLMKEANRMVVHRRREYSAREILQAAFQGKPAPRHADIKLSHKGFDFRKLHSQLAAELTCERTWLSPFPRMHWSLNSQAFSLWRL
jgi:cyclopropane fatty-acyl-phospholipid synthase-like methyltransferase